MDRRHPARASVVNGTVIRSILSNRVAVQAIGLAFGNLALLGLLIGVVGASRAYTVGIHTLYRDLFPEVLAVAAVTIAVAFLIGRRLTSTHDLVQAAWFVLWTDVVAAMIVTFTFGEMFRHPELGRAVFAETAGGLQFLAVGIGLAAGYASRRRPVSSDLQGRRA